MAFKVFIDGQEGTTGLALSGRLESRRDIEILKINENFRKDTGERKKLINQSDYVFLCLPDSAASEAVALADNPKVRIIDASTAHRTNNAWAYGLPELSAKHRAAIKKSRRVAVPGCYATGFNAILYPLVQNKLIHPYHPVFCTGISGYSGGGKQAISLYESENRPEELLSPRLYSLGKHHKHIREMMSVSGLSYPPVFTPVVDNYYNGMVIIVPFHIRSVAKRVTSESVHALFAEHYAGQNFVKVVPFMGGEAMENGFLTANKLKNTNLMQIFVFGTDDQFTICARLDNLGKGASGAAVQCMNIMMGIDETTGLL